MPSFFKVSAYTELLAVGQKRLDPKQQGDAVSKVLLDAASGVATNTKILLDEFEKIESEARKVMADMEARAKEFKLFINNRNAQLSRNAASNPKSASAAATPKSFKMMADMEKGQFRLGELSSQAKESLSRFTSAQSALSQPWPAEAAKLLASQGGSNEGLVRLAREIQSSRSVRARGEKILASLDAHDTSATALIKAAWQEIREGDRRRAAEVADIQKKLKSEAAEKATELANMCEESVKSLKGDERLAGEILKLSAAKDVTETIVKTCDAKLSQLTGGVEDADANLRKLEKMHARLVLVLTTSHAASASASKISETAIKSLAKDIDVRRKLIKKCDEAMKKMRQSIKRKK
jgi:hypothetical protein